jgi:hypothetical protein
MNIFGKQLSPRILIGTAHFRIPLLNAEKSWSWDRRAKQNDPGQDLAERLDALHFNADEVRGNVNKDLGFSQTDRIAHARRMGWIAIRWSALDASSSPIPCARPRPHAKPFLPEETHSSSGSTASSTGCSKMPIGCIERIELDSATQGLRRPSCEEK